MHDARRSLVDHRELDAALGAVVVRVELVAREARVVLADVARVVEVHAARRRRVRAEARGEVGRQQRGEAPLRAGELGDELAQLLGRLLERRARCP